MVSFFGLKFRSDKKKLQKAQNKLQQQLQQQQPQPQPRQKWDRIDQNTLGKDQYFGHNFSRPSLAVPPSLRPGTAGAAISASGSRSWQAIFGNSGATSSMTDLKPPVMRELRHNASEVNLRSNCLAQESTTSLALSGGFVARSGSSMAPDASKSEWMDPLQAHSCRDVPSARPGTAPATKSSLPCEIPPFGKLEWGTGAPAEEHLGVAKSRQDHGVGASGCPSPPQSDGVSERSYFPYHPSMGRVSPDSRRSSSRCNAPSALRNVDTAVVGAGPPSPAPSPPCTRDRPISLAPGLQRRQTCKFFDFGDHAASRRKNQVEGFIGNFADFDFGASVSRAGDSSDSSIGDNCARSKVDHWLRQPGNAPARLPSHASAPSLLGLRPTTPPAPLPPPPSTIREESDIEAGSLASSESNFKLESACPAVSAQSFPMRIDSKHQSMRMPASQLVLPMPPLLSADLAKPVTPSPYGPSAEGEENYVRSTDTQLPHRPSDLSLAGPFTRRTMEGDFPRSKGGLPRGRLPEPPTMPLPGSCPSDCADESDGDEGDATSDDDGDSGPILPEWPSFDNDCPRHSAVPPPLSTASRSPARSTASSAPSTTAPRLPSQMFSALTTSVSSSSLDLTRSFELALAESLGGGWGLPADRIPSSGSGLGGSPTRVEATRAPPRPEPAATLPPCFSDRLAGVQARSQMEGTVAAGFI